MLSEALIAVLLTGTALALAGRLTAGVRAEESAVFAALGAIRSQLPRILAEAIERGTGQRLGPLAWGST